MKGFQFQFQWKRNRHITSSLLLLAFGAFATAEEVLLQSQSPYSIVIDGGSTGSRLHIFEFVVVNALTGDTDCRRLGSERSHEPLANYHNHVNRTAVANHLMPLFEYAATVVPAAYHGSTSVQLAATAGMRLLAPHHQEAIYDDIYQGLLQHEQFVFRGIQRQDIVTLAGDLEGFYGAVAANFLTGLVDTKLKQSSPQHPPLGALDMGGSSTQIVYVPERTNDTNDTSSTTTTAAATQPSAQPSAATHLMEDDFFSTSHLEYGVDTFRERLWDTWVQDQNNSNDNDESSTPKVIDNPCTFVGYEIEWKDYRLIGTGDSTACVQQVQRLIPHHEPDEKPLLEGTVGGVEHPPVRGKFFAMSLFFFTLDSLRALSKSSDDDGPSKDAYEALNRSWPTPSIQELHDALDGLCSRNWHHELDDSIQHDAQHHAYTRPEVLPHRCIESVYMVTLLKDGYGFHPSSRDITFTFLVNGDEVEWSLGLALSMHAEQHNQQQTTPTITESNLTREEDCDIDDDDMGLARS